MLLEKLELQAERIPKEFHQKEIQGKTKIVKAKKDSIPIISFEEDGILYNILSETDKTVEVTENELPYSGDIIISAAVYYNGEEYAVTAIGDWAFYKCANLTSIEIPGGVTAIEDFIFGFCSNLTSISIPSGVTTIGIYAFESCVGLTSINISNTVTTIGRSAFYECTSLNNVHVKWINPLSINNTVFENVTISNVTLKVPKGSQIAYKTADIWKIFNIVEYSPSSINSTIATSTTIYSNPFTNGFRIKGEDRVMSITLLDINGKHLLYRSDITLESYISMDNLPTGLYVLNIQTEKGIQKEKLIKR